MAEMAGNNPEGNADEILYDKLKPALATFGADGKMICISNPLAPQGKFFNLYESAFDDPYTLMFQLPTWLSNPTISKSWLDSEKLNLEKHSTYSMVLNSAQALVILSYQKKMS